MDASVQTTAQRLAAVPGQVQARAPAPDALDLLEQFGATIVVPREAEIHGQDDPAEFCYRVLRGCVRTARLTEDGRRQVVEFLLPGDVFGFAAIDTHDVAAQAVSPVTLRRYPRRMVEALAERNMALALRLRAMVARDLRGAYDRLMLLGRKTATERLASLLLELAARLPHGPQGRIELPMNRTDIADHLGLTIETVSRMLALLKRDGTIAIARAGVQIRDRAALLQMASGPRH
jgi:CRP-like cAMP-binding protein